MTVKQPTGIHYGWMIRKNGLCRSVLRGRS